MFSSSSRPPVAGHLAPASETRPAVKETSSPYEATYRDCGRPARTRHLLELLTSATGVLSNVPGGCPNVQAGSDAARESFAASKPTVHPGALRRYLTRPRR